MGNATDGGEEFVEAGGDGGWMLDDGCWMIVYSKSRYSLNF